MSGSDLLAYTVIGSVPTVLTCGYASYWAFALRRSLAVRLYRNQALGVGVVALSVLLVTTLVIATQYASGQLNPGRFGAPLVILLFTTIFYWIDSSVLAARRTDPLLRDTLHWRRLRIVLWVVLVAVELIDVILFGVLGATEQDIPPPLFNLLFPTPFLLPGIAGIVVIPVVARRSGDIPFRRHLRWFGGFAAVSTFLLLVGGSVTQNPSTSFLGQVIIEIGLTTGGYCLYKSAKALVPLNRISFSDLTWEALLP